MTRHTYEEILLSFVCAFTPLINNTSKAIIPKVDSNIVLRLCKKVQMKIKKSSSLIELASPIMIFGDIHGHVLDLVRFINEYIMNPKYIKFKFLFLGDFVDRGEFSIETVIIIFLLIEIMPDKVFCIRGNHEFEAVTKNGDFYHQVLKAYSPETGVKVYNSIIKVFDWMSFSAKIDSNILCLHGGISDLLVDLPQLKRLPRLYHFFTNKLINDILWSDPLDIIKFQDSCRGVGCCFVKAPLEKFLADNHLNLLVRAHQCVSEGNYTHGGKCLTIFSASNYCESFQNKSSFLVVHLEKEREIKNFEAIKYLRRKDVTFKEIKALKKFH